MKTMSATLECLLPWSITAISAYCLADVIAGLSSAINSRKADHIWRLLARLLRGRRTYSALIFREMAVWTVSKEAISNFQSISFNGSIMEASSLPSFDQNMCGHEGGEYFGPTTKYKKPNILYQQS